jgi:hypothetical protein
MKDPTNDKAHRTSPTGTPGRLGIWYAQKIGNAEIRKMQHVVS